MQVIIAGLLGMSSKFVECTLGVKYRVVNEMVRSRRTNVCPRMVWLNMAMEILEKYWLSYLLYFVLSYFGGGNMFKANQAYARCQVNFNACGNGPMFGLLAVHELSSDRVLKVSQVTEKIVIYGCSLYCCSDYFGG